MIILPIGHESFTVRRLPWITFIIMAICFLAYLGTNNAVKKNQRKIYELIAELEEYYLAHPYLELDSELKKELFPSSNSEELLDIFVEQFNLYGELDEYTLQQEQEELDRLAERILEAIKENPYRKWGFVPNKFSLIKLFTHIFMHAGFFHLFSNLFIFYLCGPFIEDKWGRPLYALFYILAGLFAGFMFFARYPHSTIPLIGASGAIAGVMGAFLIRLWKVRIKFFYWLWLVVYGTFSAPAWIVLPFWFVGELFNAKIMDAVFQGESAGGVAYWAHVWGFVFGVMFAWLIKALQIEEKYINPIIEKKITLVDNTVIEDAMQLRNAGKIKQAFYLLRDAARKNPNNYDIIEAFWNLALDMGRAKDAANFIHRQIKEEIRRGDMDLAVLHWRQLSVSVPEYQINLNIKLKIAEYMVDTSYQEAEELIIKLANEIDDKTPIGILVKMERVALKMEIDVATKVLTRILEKPQISEDIKDKLEAELDNLKKQQQRFTPSIQTKMQDELETDISPEQYIAKKRKIQRDSVIQQKELKIINAIPLGIKQNKIFLQLDNMGQKAVVLSKVKMISVIRIRPTTEPPFLLIDLIMDTPQKTQSGIIKIIRLSSNRFNPKKLVPKAPNPMVAFRTFIMALMKISKAKPYPTIESVKCQKFVDFVSIKEYEKKLTTELFVNR